MTLAETYVTAVNALSPEDDPEEAVPAWYGRAEDHESVEEREVLSEHRWYNVLRNVYKCADESYFAVTWEDPATEMQEDQDWNAKAFLVNPVEVLVTKYERVIA